MALVSSFRFDIDSITTVQGHLMRQNYIKPHNLFMIMDITSMHCIVFFNDKMAYLLLTVLRYHFDWFWVGMEGFEGDT